MLFFTCRIRVGDGMLKHYLLFIFIMLLSISPSSAEEQKLTELAWQTSPNIAALFEEAGVDGAFVVYDVIEQRLIGFNRQRVMQQFVPASSYKIPHTLIALNSGAVSSVDELLSWDGNPAPFKAWEKDMSLREAIGVSNAAIYQQVSRRIGMTAMQHHIDKLGYGNALLGETVDRFWLDGPLKISALEQVRFLAKLANSALDYPSEQQAIVREIIQQPSSAGTALFAKSGWQNAPDPGIGWWVGWVETRGQIYAFALNLDIRSAKEAALREPLARRSLASMGLL